MTNPRRPSDLDMAMVALMAFLVSCFAKLPMTSVRIALIGMILLLSTLSWALLKSRQLPKTFLRLAAVLVSGALCYGLLYFPQKLSPADARAVGFSLVLFCMFSTQDTRRGSALRLMCGLFAGILIMAEIPAIFAVPLGLCVLLVIVGGWISLWSDMELGQAIVWFVRRSIRRETIFLILFLAGIGAIGIRQAQNYASAQAALSGLASSVSPGSFDSLKLSPALAMRVRFSEVPQVPMTQAYFRSAVMDRVDGFRWFQGPSRMRRSRVPETKVLNYRLDVSPRFSEYAPILDYGISLKHREVDAGLVRVNYGRDNGVFFPMAITSSWQTYMASSVLTSYDVLAREDRPRLLQEGHRVDPQLRQLARDLSVGSGSVRDFASRLGRWFHSEGFRYALDAGGSSKSLEDFLLRGKAGYCEHYAAASASLARLAGIPSRVVAGFLGGDWDADAMTLFVRDMDAHAWAEFWNDDQQRWERFDGVEFVAPNRVSLGSEAYLRSIGADIPDAADLRQKIWMSQFLMSLDEFLLSLKNASAVSAVSSLVDYGEEMAILGVLGLTFSYILLRLRRMKAQKENPQRRHVQRLAAILSKHHAPDRHTERQLGEPVRRWLERVAMQLESVAPDLQAFARAHDRFCYGPAPQMQDIKTLGVLAAKINTKLKVTSKSRP
jgi:transglutaminase-like putative cysteine protease